MKKQYNGLQLEVVRFDAEDIITTSEVDDLIDHGARVIFDDTIHGHHIQVLQEVEDDGVLHDILVEDGEVIDDHPHTNLDPFEDNEGDHIVVVDDDNGNSHVETDDPYSN